MGLIRGDRVKILAGPGSGKTGRVVFCDDVVGTVTVHLDDTISSYLQIEVDMSRCVKINEISISGEVW